MKRTLLMLLALLIAAPAFAKTTYVYTNYKLDWVKIEEARANLTGGGELSQPVIIPAEKMSSIIANLKLARSFILKKEAETQDIFSSDAAAFLGPKIADAFSKAQPNEQIDVSYLSRDARFSLKTDRITIMTMWVKNDQLHIYFNKLLAKMVGDFDKKGNYQKIIGQAKGLRVQLELSEGQSFGETVEELVIDLNHSAAAQAAEKKDEKPADAKKDQAVKKSEKSETPADAKAENLPSMQTPKERLQELEDLKANNLISEKEYKAKRKEILKDL